MPRFLRLPQAVLLVKGIRDLRAAQLLADEKTNATPRLIDAVRRADDLLAVRAGV